MYTIRDGKIVKLTDAEELAMTATRPGQFAKHLENKHGLTRRLSPIAAYYVDTVAETVERVDVVEVRGSGCEFIGPAEYAVTADGRLLPARYVFPVAKHKKPILAYLHDGYGQYADWVAPLKAGVRCPFD